MSKEFLNCVKKGGYIKTIQKGNDKYQRICMIGGKTYKGEIKSKKKTKKKK